MGASVILPRVLLATRCHVVTCYALFVSPWCDGISFVTTQLHIVC